MHRSPSSYAPFRTAVCLFCHTQNPLFGFVQRLNIFVQRLDLYIFRRYIYIFRRYTNANHRYLQCNSAMIAVAKSWYGHDKGARRGWQTRCFRSANAYYEGCEDGVFSLQSKPSG